MSHFRSGARSPRAIRLSDNGGRLSDVRWYLRENGISIQPQESGILVKIQHGRKERASRRVVKLKEKTDCFITSLTPSVLSFPSIQTPANPFVPGVRGSGPQGPQADPPQQPQCCACSAQSPRAEHWARGNLVRAMSNKRNNRLLLLVFGAELYLLSSGEMVECEGVSFLGSRKNVCCVRLGGCRPYVSRLVQLHQCRSSSTAQASRAARVLLPVQTSSKVLCRGTSLFVRTERQVSPGGRLAGRVILTSHMMRHTVHSCIRAPLLNRLNTDLCRAATHDASCAFETPLICAGSPRLMRPV